EVRGRLASLLEVGTGFHPELSGRENIYLNGAILGMTRAEVARKFDQIVAFAEVEKFIDTPVKRYSSGMYVRLAFAVAAHLEPDILVIDEVLAVGDASFQKRCLGKMKDVAGEGRTVLFVSHNMLAVQRLCSKAIWLDRGAVQDMGAAEHIVGEYLRAGSEVANVRSWLPESAPATAAFRLLGISASNPSSSGDDGLRIDQPIVLAVEYENLVEGARLNLSVHIFSSDDTLVFNAIPVLEREWFGRPFPRGRFRCSITVPPNLLNADTYRVELLAVHEQNRVEFRHDSALFFEVLDSPLPIQWHGRVPGVVRPLLPWRTERLS
ncbi:MAG: ABC transporter ATP-binding protein, partial [Casimicrobiaceae bacterium]